MSAIAKLSSQLELEHMEAGIVIEEHGIDPSTFIQRPTSAKTPDVSHILTSLFGSAFII